MNLKLQPDGFYELPRSPGAPVLHVSPDGDDARPGTDPAAPIKTINAARKRLTPGKPGTVLLLAGARFVDQPLWVDGGDKDAPHVYATYGGTARAVIDNSNPTPSDTAAQVRGHTVLSDLDFICEAGKPGIRPHGAFDFFAQNVRAVGAEVGWDMLDATAHLHRCVTLDCYSPAGGKSQGAYIQRGRLRLTESVWHRCGWRPGVPLSFYASDKNHCLYVDEDCLGPAEVYGCFFGEPCSHGTQLRTGGVVKRSLYYRCPIGGFAQGPVGIIEDSFFEQQNATLLGHGTAPGAEQRGWGWSLESTTAEMHRCGFYRGGPGIAPRAIDLAKINPGRTPPRTGASLTVAATRVAGWHGGVSVSAPPNEIGPVDIEVDRGLLRWPGFTVDPYVAQLRALERGSDWSLPSRLAADGYAALESVMPANGTRAVIDGARKAMREVDSLLGKL